jgi:predicted SAM-dependent methyltransferase
MDTSNYDNGSAVKLNLGCGLQCPDGWLNIDSSMGARLSKMPVVKKVLHKVLPSRWGILPNVEWPSNVMWMNITREFPFEENSVDCIYSSHTFEHLSYSEAAFVLKECYRVIKPGGVIRIIVPDLAQIVDNYLSYKERVPHLAAKKLLEETLYFEIPVPNSLHGFIKFHFKRKNNHHFLYDKASLAHQLEQAGFHDISEKNYGISNIENIKEIDIEDRFKGAICVEGIKLHSSQDK